jgi:hypothetical protein
MADIWFSYSEKVLKLFGWLRLLSLFGWTGYFRHEPFQKRKK